MELPSWLRFVEAVGIIQSNGTKRCDQLYTQTGSTEEASGIDASGVGPKVTCIKE